MQRLQQIAVQPVCTSCSGRCITVLQHTQQWLPALKQSARPTSTLQDTNKALGILCHSAMLRVAWCRHGAYVGNEVELPAWRLVDLRVALQLALCAQPPGDQEPERRPRQQQHQAAAAHQGRLHLQSQLPCEATWRAIFSEAHVRCCAALSYSAEG